MTGDRNPGPATNPPAPLNSQGAPRIGRDEPIDVFSVAGEPETGGNRASGKTLGAGFGLSQATSYRYIDEVIDVLAERAPGLREALERALAEGTPYVILDGKIVDSGRCHEKTLSRKGREIDLWYSGEEEGLRREHPGTCKIGNSASV